MTTRAQIVATIGPATENEEVLRALVENQIGLARFNFEWFNRDIEHARIERIRRIAAAQGRVIPIIADLPGPRVQLAEGHTYDDAAPFAITPADEAMLQFCADEKLEYVALSFIGHSDEVRAYRACVTKHGGTQKLIAKIERKIAVEAIDSILEASDAVMVARGDLGKEIPLEELPFVQKMIVAKAKAAGKPVIVATQMLLSMTEHDEPTRAEVTDVEEAVTQGADAVMLSEETASGKFPVEAVSMMERIIVAAERHEDAHTLHLL